MSISFQNGAINISCKYYEKTNYDVANNKITAQFDGRGAITKYAVINKYSIFSFFSSVYSIDGEQLDWGVDKKVEIIGKRQVVTFFTDKADFRITQFLDNGSNAIYTRAEVTARQDIIYRNVLAQDIDFTSYVKEFFASRYKCGNISKLLWGALTGKKPRSNGKSVRCDLTADFYLDIASRDELRGLEPVWRYHTGFSMGGTVKGGETRCFDYVLSAGSRRDSSYSDVERCLDKFDSALKEADEYIAAIPYPEGLDERMKAYYASTLNCSLSNYKDLGKWKGFLAGIVYQSPARTYYRDGYWTVLSVLPVRPDLVRNEIITLSQGIDKKTGKCPSAVKYNFKNFWGYHYDSPSFFAIMLYDYIAHTGDKSVLKERCPCGTVLDAAVKAMGRLEQSCDDTGLLIKSGDYNRRDWCDNVFRDGYVTYDEALFARAMYAMSRLFAVSGRDGSQYYAKYEEARQAINDLLWEEEKGWFVNFKSGKYTEDNLSIDTVPVLLFGLTSEERAVRTLRNMERYLESRNNLVQCAGDFGTLSVWPFYKDIGDTMSKSALPYNYHNGGDWPYWSGMYAYAKLMYGLDYEYPLVRWFDFNLEKGNYTPVEYFCPIHKDGSMLQAWSSTGAFVLKYRDGNFFRKEII